MTIIQDEVNKIQLQRNDDYKINAVLLKYFFRDGEDDYDSIANITDGANDKGIDFGYHDIDNEVLNLCQTKNHENYAINDIMNDFYKMLETVIELRETSKINTTNRKLLSFISKVVSQHKGNVKDLTKHLHFFIPKSNIASKEDARNKMYKHIKQSNLANIEVNIHDGNSITQTIQSIKYAGKPVQEEASLVVVSKSDANDRNFLEYKNSTMESVVFTTKASSLHNLYWQSHLKGLFALNLRDYIKNKSIDEKIKKSFRENPEDFWFLNNGITITCKDFKIDGKKIFFTGFSILNGGQTTYLIGNHFKLEAEDFDIQCRLVKTLLKDEKSVSRLWEKISQATNTQKPINDRDLRANSPEMRQLKQCLLERKWDLEIRRGEPKEKQYSTIKNDEFGKIIRSFIYQEPGSAKSKKSELFSTSNNDKVYDKIYKKIKIRSNIDFIDSILHFNEYYQNKKLAFENVFDNEERKEILYEMFSNGDTFILAVSGLLFKYVNSEFKLDEIKKLLGYSSLCKRIQTFENTGLFFTSYKADDIDNKMIEFIKEIGEILVDAFEDYNEDSNNIKKTVANITKSDSFYNNYVVKEVINYIGKSRSRDFIQQILVPLFKIQTDVS